MKFIKGVIRFFMGLGVAAIALAFIFFDLSYMYDFLIQTAIPAIENVEYMPESDIVRQILGALVLFLALWAAFPSFKMRSRKRTISFSGMHGNHVFELDSLERDIVRGVKALPEAKQITDLHLDPMDGGRRLVVTGEVVLKQTGLSGAQNAANRVSEFIAAFTGGILGVEKEMITVNLNVSAILVDPKAIAEALMNPKPEPKLLQEQPVQAQAPQPAAYTPVTQGVTPGTVYQPIPNAAPVQYAQPVPQYAPPPQGAASELVMPGEPLSTIQEARPKSSFERSGDDSFVNPSDVEAVSDDGSDSSERQQPEAL